MKRILLLALAIMIFEEAWCWGFYGHKQINYLSVFLLPKEMLKLYKPNIEYLSDNAVNPDKRRYIIPAEAPRHYLDLDKYGSPPWNDLPRNWKDAVAKFGVDTLNAHGIAPWWIQVMLGRLTDAFRTKNKAAILRNSAEIGHYIADIHVPLHASSNHNGQLTGQHGIHGFWESRIPELLAEKEWDFFIGRAGYISDPLKFTWDRLMESGVASDTVLRYELQLSQEFGSDRKYAFENRNGIMTKQYSSEFSRAYDKILKGMIERRMRQSIYAVASFWYTAWVNAGQPDLSTMHTSQDR